MPELIFPGPEGRLEGRYHPQPKPDAPFVCIEPWYGLADEAGFTGDFSVKAAVNRLAPGETFKASYTIIIESV